MSTIFDWTIAGSGAPVRAGGAVILTEPGQIRSRFDERTPTYIVASGTSAFMSNLDGRFHKEDTTKRTAENHSPATDNTVATLSFSASPDRAHCIENLVWSYSGTPAANSGNLKITNGGTTIFNQDITAGGPGFFPFSTPLKGSANADMVVTLAPGGASGVYSKVSVNHWTERA